MDTENQSTPEPEVKLDLSPFPIVDQVDFLNKFPTLLGVNAVDLVRLKDAMLSAQEELYELEEFIIEQDAYLLAGKVDLLQELGTKIEQVRQKLHVLGA